MKTALITGITGQDGSYLAELLLQKGYEVHGIVRRASSLNTSRLSHLLQTAQNTGPSVSIAPKPNAEGHTGADHLETVGRLHLHYGDLSDALALSRVIQTHLPDEVYNLGAQSHVKVSWDQAQYTADVTGIGVLRLLEAIREVQDRMGKSIRFYQASSSEMFGSAPPPQSLSTPFHPRSPYACAKVYGFWQTVNHRESYDLFACNGVLFNHECLSENTPILIRNQGVLNVLPVGDLVPFLRKGRSVQGFEPQFLEVWDGKSWTRVRAITATRRRTRDANHRMLSIQARAGAVCVTSHHTMIDAEEDTLPARDVQEDQRLLLAQSLPPASDTCALTPEMAEFLGLLVAEGYVSPKGGVRWTNNDPTLRERVAHLWHRLFLGQSYEWLGASGSNPENGVVQMNLNGDRAAGRWLREQIYLSDGFKRVPRLVLNAPPEIQAHFLRGYYAGDGLKAGKGESIKTNSAVLAQGLVWLYSVQGQECSVYVEHRDTGATYYQLNLFSNQKGRKGAHLKGDPSQVRRVEAPELDSEWVFDLETESGVFCAGVGRLVVHNSPRRGETFVTRKITRAVGRIKMGLQNKLLLGNLDAKRDWGHARDYVEAMHLMLQHFEARDYVVATGEAYSVREFAQKAFALVDLDWEEFVEQSPKFFRLAEVEHLLGDPTDTFSTLNWRPKISFDQLVREMVEADLEAAKRERVLLEAGLPLSLVGMDGE